MIKPEYIKNLYQAAFNKPYESNFELSLKLLTCFSLWGADNSINLQADMKKDNLEKTMRKTMVIKMTANTLMALLG